MSDGEALETTRGQAGGALGPLRLSVIVPVLNEKDNVPILIERLDQCLSGIAWECIVVDDNSRDGTADVVRAIAARRGNVRVIQRIGRRGLASACTEGIMASHADFAVVIDGDLQHDETLIPKMFAVLDREPVDLVVGTRYAGDGSNASMSTLRRVGSETATKITHMVLGKSVSDPMSGFFMIRTDRFRQLAPRLSNMGYKILADIVMSSPTPLTIRELPYSFAERHAGESKMDARVVLEFFMLLLDKRIGGIVPIRFVEFVAVGMIGLVLHLTLVWILYREMGVDFPTAQIVATFIAMTSNFLLNNQFTYRDRRLKGPRLIRGLITFDLACAVGAIANYRIANDLFQQEAWWVIAAAVGMLISAVWNYAVTGFLTWPKASNERV